MPDHFPEETMVTHVTELGDDSEVGGSCRSLSVPIVPQGKVNIAESLVELFRRHEVLSAVDEDGVPQIVTELVVA